MFVGGLSLHRPERVPTNVQSDECLLHAHIVQPVQQALGEVQTCGRSGSAALSVGIDSLVSFGVIQRLMDIGRQWYDAHVP